MSPLGPILSLLLGLFGIAYASAIALTPEAPVRFAQVETDLPQPVSACPEFTPCDTGNLVDDNGCATSVCAEPYTEPSAEEQAQTEEQCLKEHRESMDSLERNELRESERRIKELVRNKYPVPPEVHALIERMKSMHAGASNVTRCEDRGTLVNDIYAVAQEFNDIIRDVEEAMNNARCVKDNRQEIKNFERHSIKDIERRIAQGRRKKVAIPNDVTEGVARMKALLAEAKKGTTCDETREPLNEVYRIQEDIDDGLILIDFLADLPRITKEITREMKTMQQQWKSTVARAKRAKKINFSDLIARGQAHFDTLQGFFQQFKAALATGDFEQIRTVMEDAETGAQESREELEETMITIGALLDAPRYMKEITRRMKDMRQTAKSMQRNEGFDTSQLVACLDGLQSRIDETKTLAAQRSIDSDAFADASSDIGEGFSDCEDVERALRGEEEESAFGEFVPDELLKPAAPEPVPAQAG